MGSIPWFVTSGIHRRVSIYTSVLYWTVKINEIGSK